MPADVDHLAAVAPALAARVGDYGPDDNSVWLDRMAPTRDDLKALCVILAAAVPIDALPWDTLIRWTSSGDGSRPVDERRLPAAARAVLDLKPPPDPVDHVAVDLACRGHRLALNRAEKRAVEALMTAAGASSDEIAYALGVTPDAVHQRHTRARQRARALEGMETAA